MANSEILDQLAAFEPSDLPVVSLYLNTQPDQRGRTNFEPYVRKELTTLERTYPLRSAEQQSLERDAERIRQYLQQELQPSTNSLAIFACAGKDDFFVAVPLDTKIEDNQIYVGSNPHLYTLAKLHDQYRRYAAVIVNTNYARILVFSQMKTIDSAVVDSPKVSRPQVGGWSQSRYQRSADNDYLHHAKDVVEALDKIVREDEVEQIVFGGDEVIMPILKGQLPAHLAEKVVTVLPIDIRTPEHEILEATLEAMREQDAKDDAERVERLLNAYRSRGLGTVGLRGTLKALENGQVDELLLSAKLDQIRGEGGDETETFLADELVTKAKQTGAEVRFIEDQTLLATVGGVGATLRFRI